MPREAGRGDADAPGCRSRQIGRRRGWLRYDTVMVGEVVQQLQAYFAAHPANVEVAYLFGSIARGSAGDESDVDVAVVPAGPAAGPFAALQLDLESDLERALGRPVQLVVLDRAPADLVHRVLRDGVLLYERDRRRRIAFEVRARNEYFDLLPFYAQYRRRVS